ncbi:MAG: hypothetical protein JW862_07295 [Anaerolineales bacterium]|nr:hypothetical protein [Anaerolineales bacterium]
MANRTNKLLRFVLIGLIFFTSLPWQSGYAAYSSQTSGPELRARNLLEELTPEERVGQLFLVTFPGTSVGAETRIYELIANYYIGGVILSSNNENFAFEQQNSGNIWSLINQLQTDNYLNSETERIDVGTGEFFNPSYVPLFIGISQNGDGYPNDEILHGLTPLPSQLAIGATWNPEQARQVGQVLGSELNALGINLLLGPSLDVNETPRPESPGDLGVSTFGGDPFWVGEMSRAYIDGVHQGSGNRVAVVSKHFPGLGSSDRLPENEVATVRKTLEQLKQIELAPFFAVTGNAESTSETTDALLTSHIRYQGLQGNIRATTRPVSLDQQALSLLMDLEPFANWRLAGGVMISDDLNSRAVRSFYDPSGESFNIRRAALDALLAGNDLLYIGSYSEIVAENGEISVVGYSEIVDTIQYFVQRYKEDPTFAGRVDNSVLRILTLKYRLYSFFARDIVFAPGELEPLGTANQVTFDVARTGATLINPSQDELDNVIPDSPQINDRIVFFTDNRPLQLCSTCLVEMDVPTDALEQAVIELYGPNAGGQVQPFFLSSHSFTELEVLLDDPNQAETTEGDLRRANWVIFLAQGLDPGYSTSRALKRLLSERPDLIQGKISIAFSMNAPYYLDATDISKLTAYYGLFSKQEPFIDVAARLLFREIPIPLGALPVSVSGVGYDLFVFTSPDPEQVIPLYIDIPGAGLPEDAPVVENIDTLEYQLGENLPLRTGVILDYNGNPVPNNTTVQFQININGNEQPAITSSSVNGIARLSLPINQSGNWQINATSGLAHSNPIVLEIPQEEQTPTPTPTLTPTETPTSTPVPTIPAPTATPVPVIEEPEESTGLLDWSLALIVCLSVAWGAARTGALVGRVRRGVRWGFAALIGGLLTYSYTILGLPGSEWAVDTNGHWGVLLLTLAGAFLSWGISALILEQQRKRA